MIITLGSTIPAVHYRGVILTSRTNRVNLKLLVVLPHHGNILFFLPVAEKKIQYCYLKTDLRISRFKSFFFLFPRKVIFSQIAPVLVFAHNFLVSLQPKPDKKQLIRITRPHPIVICQARHFFKAWPALHAINAKNRRLSFCQFIP